MAMGVKIHGPCAGCHRQADLVVDEAFCSEKCKQRHHDSLTTLRGFVWGVMITAFFAGLFVLWLYVTHPPPKRDTILEIETQIEQQRQLMEVIKAMADASSAKLSNDLQRAIQTRELEKQ